MKSKLSFVTLKVESSYGVDSTPTVADNALLVQNLAASPLEMETEDYMPVSNKFGGFEKIVGATWCSISFDVLLCSGGTPVGNASSVPNCDPVLRASALSRIITAGVTTSYVPISSQEESATMYYYMDGVLQKMVGLRGDLSFGFNAKKAPVMSFKGLGLNVPMTDLPLPIPTLPTVPRPLAVNKANSTLAIDTSFMARVSSFSVALNNDVQYRNLTNREDVVVVDRNIGGKLTFEMPLVAEKDFLGASGICTRATKIPLYIEHGTVSGNIVRMDLPEIQLLNPKPKEEAGILMLECDIHVVRNVLNSVMVLQFK